RKIRERIERDVAHRPIGADQQDRDDRDDEVLVLRREANDALDHGFFSRLAGALAAAIAAREARRRDSESMRKFARVTTWSPSFKPSTSSTFVPSESPSFTSS